MKKAMVNVLIMGWVSLSIHCFALWGSFVRKVEPLLLDWRNDPFRCFLFYISCVIGGNIFTILAFFAGLYVWKRGDNKGKVLLLSAALLFIIESIVLLIRTL